ncbi:TonB-dependent receptor [Arenibacter sp. 6A1]|uniref:SusC/RagA family TonB-linked outer membrane protein n=1 Tax=Arenibacter sp. 6A1 TaxID=2720391 RepID=UPI0014472BBD|nr:TonB-dependent receptor [Arenibacter sp. 6A1]NKI27526.1 TonB-dependent receptor [Arenibacter sp. 6A1]
MRKTNKKKKKQFQGTPTSALNRGIVFILVWTLTSMFALANDGAFVKVQDEISGTVTDNSGLPLIGATVVVQGSSLGVTTDFDGKYSIAASNGSVLEFSYIGMLTKTVEVVDFNDINVSLEEDVNQLEEVVIVGYGTQKKLNVTGAVESINLEDEIGERPVPNVTSMLQGVLPGLSISQTGNGGEPGASQNLNIRGLGTLTGNSGEPYILVDGFPLSASQLNSISPSDIENVTVLKDAASAAIYGSKAAFGVILITTKGGVKGRTVVKFSTKYALSSPTSLPKMANSLEFATAINQAQTNSGASNWFKEEALDKIKAYLNGELPYSTELNEQGNRWLSGRSGFANTDWWKLFFRDSAPRSEHNVSVSGGTESTKYYISGNYFEQDGQMNYAIDKYDRASFNINLKTEATDWLRFDVTTRYTKEKRIFPSGGFQNFTKDIVYHQISRAWPTSPAFDPDGNAIDANILRFRDAGNTSNDYNTTLVQLGADFEPVKNWITRVSYNRKVRGSQAVRERFAAILNYPDGSTNNVGYKPNNIQRVYTEGTDQLVNLVSSFNTSLGSHHLKILGGYEQRLDEWSNVLASRSNLITKFVPAISTAVGEDYVGDTARHYSTQGVFGRFNYDYKEKYILELNGRYDGSSHFRDGKRWGFFPSASIGYNISKEAFWKPLKGVVNNLKFRASWGELGNHDTNLGYLYQETLGSNESHWLMNDQQTVYITRPNIVSPNLTWETVTTTDLGINAGLFKNKLNVTYDYFTRVTSDMIGPAAALPALLGDNAPRENNAELTTKGWEISFSWKQKFGNFSYNFGANLSDNTSKVTKYNNPTGIFSSYRKGQVIGDIWGYETVGLFASDEDAAAAPDQSIFRNRWLAGDTQYADLDGDGEITRGDNTESSPGDRKIIGNNRARYNYGFNLGASYKGFNLSVLFQGVAKRDYYFPASTNLFYGFRGNIWQTSVTKASLDYWTPENTDAYFPKPYFNAEHLKNTQTQTKFLQDASYLRLKNVQLSYSLPKEVLGKIGMSRLQFYITGENLWTKTKLNENFDPEVLGGGWGGGKIYPLSKVFSFGVNLDL